MMLSAPLICGYGSDSAGPILDLQSRAQTRHWKFAFVAGIEAANWRRSLADYAWWRRSFSSADDADCVSVTPV